MANRNQYRGSDGRFERCTVQKLFGIPTNEKETNTVAYTAAMCLPLLLRQGNALNAGHRRLF